MVGSHFKKVQYVEWNNAKFTLYTLLDHALNRYTISDKLVVLVFSWPEHIVDTLLWLLWQININKLTN